MNTVFCKDRNEWRDWLQKNHESEPEIWLIYMKKHTKKKTIIYSEAVEEAICFGWIDSTVKRIDEEKYMQKYTPRNSNSMWSLVNKKRVEKMISENKMTTYGMEKVDIAKKNGQWDKAYTSQKKISIPDDLKKALMMNKTAWDNFQNFAPSYQNIYSGWIASAKRPETIEKRIQIVVERSKKSLKPGML